VASVKRRYRNKKKGKLNYSLVRSPRFCIWSLKKFQMVRCLNYEIRGPPNRVSYWVMHETNVRDVSAPSIFAGIKLKRVAV
jgi:hypothetical protein